MSERFGGTRRGSFTRRTNGILLALALSVCVVDARADDAGKPDNRARAQQLFESALTDAEAGNFAGACPKFLASQEADPKTSTLLNLANCYEKNGQSASAWGAFREAQLLARKAGRADWESTAKARADAIEPKLVRLTITVPDESRVTNLVVVRDGSKLAVGEYGVAIPIDPGVHVVTASADGRESFAIQVDVQADSVAVTVPVLTPVAAPPKEPVASPKEAPGAPPSTRWSTLKTAGAITAGVGGAAVLASGILGIVANGNYGDAQDRCSAPPRGCPAEAVADADGAYNLAAGATVTLIVGAVLVAGGAAMFFLAPNAASAERAERTGSARARVAGSTAGIRARPSAGGFGFAW